MGVWCKSSTSAFEAIGLGALPNTPVIKNYKGGDKFQVMHNGINSVKNG